MEKRRCREEGLEEGENEVMELWCEGMRRALSVEEGLLEEDFDVSLVAGVGVHLGKVLDFPLFLLG